MRVEYLIKVRISAGKFFQAVEDVENRLNFAMHNFGFDEKIVITSLLPISLTVARELTPTEIEGYSKEIEKVFTKDYGFAQVESFTLVLPHIEEDTPS